jgi:hypothetical protein
MLSKTPHPASPTLLLPSNHLASIILEGFRCKRRSKALEREASLMKREQDK